MAFDGLRIWFLTGSQDLYGEATLRTVREQSAAIVAGLGAAPDIPVEIVHRPTVTTPDGIRRACLDASADDACIGVIAWMHTFSPAKMWIAGLQALQKPFLHLHTQYGRDLPYADIDMDFMNLNQSAHGDREFAYIVSRLRHPGKVIAGHWQDPAVQARIGAWARAAAGAHEARTPEGLPLRRQHARGGRHRGRQGGGPGAPRHRGEHLPRQRAGGHRRRRSADAEVDRLCAEYDEAYEVVARAARRAASAASRCATPRASSWACAPSWRRAASAPSRDTFQDLGALKQLPGIGAQRLMADGYGFAGEGDWKTSALVRIVKVMSQGLDGRHLVHGGLHLRLRGGCAAEPRRAHAGGLPDHQRGHAEVRDPPALRGRARGPRAPRLHGRAPGPGVVVGLCDMGTRLRLVANEIDAVEPPAGPAQAAGGAGALEASPEPRPRQRRPGCWPAARTTPASARAVGLEVLEDFAEMVGVELLAIDDDTDARTFRRELRWNQVYWHLARAV